MKNNLKNWKNYFKKGKEIVLVTSSIDGRPNANIVMSLGFYNNKILISDCQMTTTIKNLKENPQSCLIGGYFKIKDKTEFFFFRKIF